MTKLRDTIHVLIEYYDGQDEGDNGQSYYVASCVENSGTTDGATWHELLQNISQMVAASLEEEDVVARYHLVPNPRIVITMELPENYAQIA